MYLICLIFIIIICIIILVTLNNNNVELDNEIKQQIIKLSKDNNEKEYDFFNNYESYRLGDSFYNCEKPGFFEVNLNNSTKKYHVPLKDYNKLYPGSILSEYLIKSNYSEKKWNILINIINYRFITDLSINKKTDCLMHIRLGDVIDQLCYGKYFFDKFYKDITTKNGDDESNLIWCHYIESLKYFQNKIKILKKFAIKKVYLMAGSHIKLKSYKYSTYYINKIVEEIEKAGLQVELKLGSSPDEDLLFSMNFNYFISSSKTSTYCRLIKELNQKINPDFVIL